MVPYSSRMTSMKPETMAHYRELLSASEVLRKHPDLVDMIVRVTDEFYDMHVSSGPHRPFIEAAEERARRRLGKNVQFFLPRNGAFPC